MTKRTGLLLCNLGTPDAPTAAKVRPYLREFLMDERVINIAKPLRWSLVNGVIAPFRSPKSAEAYKEIWFEEGSPLLKISEKLTEKVAAKLPDTNVKLAMRYGNPSMESVLEEMYDEGVEQIIIFPLYPQYSSAATGSSVQKAFELVQKKWVTPAICTVPAFFDDGPYLDSVVAAGKETHETFAPDHVLFSFHGLPKEHMTLGDRSGAHCQKVENCCEIKTEANRNCYSAQSYVTAHILAEKMGLKREDYTIAFQSRLPGKPWLTPFTDEVVVRLAKEGKKRMAVYCPAFVADCLETLEEIGIRAEEDFLEAGGEALRLIPCPNYHDDFVDAVIGIAKKHSAWL